MEQRFAALQFLSRVSHLSAPTRLSFTVTGCHSLLFHRLKSIAFDQSFRRNDTVDAVYRAPAINRGSVYCSKRKGRHVVKSTHVRCYSRSFWRFRISPRQRKRAERMEQLLDWPEDDFFSNNALERVGISNYLVSPDRSRDQTTAKEKFPVQHNTELQSHLSDNGAVGHLKPGRVKLILRRPFSPSEMNDNEAAYLPRSSPLSDPSCMASGLDPFGDPKSLAASLEALERVRTVSMSDAAFLRLAEQFELKARCRPLIEYLFTVGLEEDDVQKIVIRNKSSLMSDVDDVKNRLKFLVSVGVKSKDLRRLIVRHPKILNNNIEKTMQLTEYLRMLELPESKLGRVITLLPTLLECGPEKLLRPRVKYLLEVVGVKKEDLSRIICKSPQILAQNLEESLEPRIDFFLKELQLTKDTFARMVTKHPQLLHYSVQDSIRPRVDFLRSLGLSDEEIRKIVSRLTQVLSLSIENCLEPKVNYLFEELRCELGVLVSFPAFLSLSLDQRIKPRHRFLVAKKRLPPGPFPMRFLTSTDEFFCKHDAKSTVEEYNLFRERLILSSFAKEFERKHSLQHLKPRP